MMDVGGLPGNDDIHTARENVQTDMVGASASALSGVGGLGSSQRPPDIGGHGTAGVGEDDIDIDGGGATSGPKRTDSQNDISGGASSQGADAARSGSGNVSASMHQMEVVVADAAQSGTGGSSGLMTEVVDVDAAQSGAGGSSGLMNEMEVLGTGREYKSAKARKNAIKMLKRKLP